MDELRADRGEQYTPWDLMAQEAEKANGTIARRPSTRGVRTGSRATNYVSGTPDEIHTGMRALSPAERQMRDQMWQRHEQIAQHIDKVVGATARTNDPNWQRARAISNAIKSVRRDPSSGLPDISEMTDQLSSRFGVSGARLAGGYEALLAGRTSEASAAVSDAFGKFGSESGLKKGRRRLLRALDPTSPAFNKQPADVQLFAELGGAIRAQASVDANPDVVLKKRTITGRKLGPSHYNRGAGLTKTAFETGKEDYDVDSAGIVSRQGTYINERLKTVVPKTDEEMGIETRYTTSGRRLRIKVDPETGTKTVLGEHDEAANAKRRQTEREVLRAELDEKAQNAYKRGQTPSMFGPEGDPSLRAGQLPNASYSTFSDATGRPQDLGQSGRQHPRRPTGPHPRNTEQERERAAREKAYKDFLNGQFFKRFSERMKPPSTDPTAQAPGLTDKLKAMALHGNSPPEQATALDIMRNRGYTGHFSKDELARLAGMGLDIKGLAKGGPVKALRVYRGGAMDQSGNFLRQRTSYDGLSYVSPRRDYAETYAAAGRETHTEHSAISRLARMGYRRDDQSLGSGASLMSKWDQRIERSLQKGMVHEGSIPASKIAPASLVDKIGRRAAREYDYDSGGGTYEEWVNAQIQKHGYAARQTDEREIQVLDPKYLVNHLAGPKGPLPRMAGGEVKSKLIAKTLFSRPFGESVGAGPNVARANSYEWKKARAAQIRRQPFCGNCGIGRAEARGTGNPLTADHITSQAHGGAAYDPENLQTLCRSCNSSKGHLSGAVSNYAKPRKWKRAEGGPVGGLIGALLRGTVDVNGTIKPGREAESQRLNRLAEQKRGGWGVYKVNERKEEGYESNDGTIQMLLGEKERLFVPPKDGKVIPHHKVPEWLRRAQEKQARTGFRAEKELGRADGGDVEAPKLPPFHGKSGQKISNYRGRHQGFIEGVGKIIRVFVINAAEIGASVGAKLFGGAATGSAGAPYAATPAKTPRRRTKKDGPAPLAGTEATLAPSSPYTEAEIRRQQEANKKRYGGNGPVPIPTAAPAGPPPPAAAGTPFGPPLKGKKPPVGAAGAPPPGWGGPMGGPMPGIPGAPMPGAAPGAAPPPPPPPPPGPAGGPPPPGPGGPFGGPPPPTPLSGRASRRLGYEARQMARANAEDYASSYMARIQGARTNVAEAMQLTPTRAFQVMVGQIAQTKLGGRGGIIERRDIANRASGAAQRQATAYQALTQREAELRLGISDTKRGIVAGTHTSADLDAQRDELRDVLGAKTNQRQRLGRFTERAEKTAANVVKAPDIARSLAVGGVSIIGAGILFTAAMEATQVGMEMLGKVAMSSADALSGFAITAQKVTNELSETIRGAGGALFAKSAFAGEAAKIGLPAGTKLDALLRVATTQAGNANLSAGIDMIRANNSLSTARLSGLGTPVPGLSQATGGFMGTPIGATSSTFELMSGVLTGRGDTKDKQALNWLGNNALQAVVNPGGAIMETLTGGPGSIFGNKQADQQIEAEAEKANKAWFDSFNGYAKKAGAGFGELLENSSIEAVHATEQAFRDAGLTPDQAARMVANNRALSGIDPNADRMVNREKVLKYGQGVVQGAGMPTREFILEQMMSPGGLPAQFRAIQRQNEFQGKQDSISLAENLMAHPIAPSSTGIIPVSSESFAKGVPEGVIASGQKYIDMINTAKADLAGMSQAGRAWLEAKVPPDVIASVSALGEQITSLQSSITDLNTGFQAESFQRQTDLAKRSLGDALGLAGKQAATFRVVTGYTDEMVGNTHKLVPVYGEVTAKVEELGRLQRAQMMNSREQERLSLRMSQRQINFNLALAKIQVPGATPAEMAAQVAFAKQRANEEQAMHDLNKEGFDLGVSIQDIEINRAVTDQIAQLKQEFEGFHLNVETADVERTLPILQATMDSELAVVDRFKTQGLAFEQTLLDAHTALETASGQFVDTFDISVQEVLDKIVEIQTLLNGGITPTGTTPSGTTDPNQPLPIEPGTHGLATGSWRTGNEVARLHAGEMVIPANQAAWMRSNMLGATMPSSGSGSVTVININNPTVRNDGDIDMIARRVEEVMNRRASLIL